MVTIGDYEFEWDERKRIEVIAKHSVDLRDAAEIFAGPIITHLDERFDYGEERRVSIGMVGTTCLVVVYTRRGNLIRLITAWRGGRREQDRYAAVYAEPAADDEGEWGDA